MNSTNPRNVCKLLTTFLPSDVFNLKKLLFSSFIEADLVNTATTIPLKVGEQRKIYTSTLGVCIYSQYYSPRLRAIVSTM